MGGQGEGGGREPNPSGKRAVVRHVPIVVEGEESDCDKRRNVNSDKLCQERNISDCSSS